MPKVTEAYLETRRQHILDAAITCFARKGFRQTTRDSYYKVRMYLWAEAIQNPKIAEKARLLRQQGKELNCFHIQFKEENYV